MTRHIRELNIESYRGIDSLSIKDLSNVNVILGDNNSGKTSLLEVIQILHKPSDFENMVMIARQRERYRTLGPKYTQTQFSSFLGIFNGLSSKLHISFSCKTNSGDARVLLTGKVVDSLLSEKEISEIQSIYELYGTTPTIDERIKSFSGDYFVNTNIPNVNSMGKTVIFNKYSRILSSNYSKTIYPLEIVSPMDHIVNDGFVDTTGKSSFKEYVIDILKSSFDSCIQDLRTIEDEDGKTLRMIDHAELGSMPLSTYGDGIKKVIALSNAIAKTENGVILIDEFETSIHTNAMDKVFTFILDACMKRDIQLFLTTHSIEALDCLLRCNDSYLDNMRIITLKKRHNKTFSRVLSGREAEKLRTNNSAELR